MIGELGARLGRRLPGRLWGNREFMAVWGAAVLCQIGWQITYLAMPLAAILLLQATPAQVGVLGATEFAPVLVVSLLAGVWVDRWPRRRTTILSNLARAAAVALGGALLLLGVRRIEPLYVLGFLAGAATALFEVAYLAYLPTTVATEDLVEANSKVKGADSAAQIAGPGLGGLLIQLTTAPVALLVSSFAYVASAVSLTRVPAGEAAEARPRRSIWREIGEGLSFTLRDARLFHLAAFASWFNLFEQAILVLYLLYGSRSLNLGPGALGLSLSLGSVGALCATVVARPLGRRLGIGPTMLWAVLLSCTAPVLIPLATVFGPFKLAALVLAFFLYALGLTAFNVHTVALRQTITPNHLLGRILATYRFVTFGTIPLGAIVGGALGQTIGLQPTLFAACAGLLIGALAFALSPVSRLHSATVPATAG